ncbi:hypothetical protein [Autumnicola musiva]|uniref:Glycoside hydrolase family 5 domain-containing protein n=1 Tax=Autumnicola musiva TaxID=3075589 RepID=A0ABU3D8N8_9FLAO|nr:hypothetical protein [Zunongwangia sp. F117]MDT0677896.1 hypothetical protein [Zunongwangia sp. F117]
MRYIYRTSLLVLMICLFWSCASSDNDPVDATDDLGQSDDGPVDTSFLETQNLGVNFNEQLDYIDNDALLALHTDWVRGFVDFFRYYEDPTLISSDAKITRYLGLQTYGFKTVLNIKWLFRGSDYPAAGSPEMASQMAVLEQILARVWDKTDVIVVGNEPFIETDPEDYGAAMYDYYVEATNVVKAYGEEHGERPIFFGSFDNMYQSRRQNLEVLNDLLDFSSNTSWIAGVDLHIHHSSTQEMRDALDFVSARIRDDQKMMVSEFSLMKHFRSNLTGSIPVEFANEYGFSDSWMNYEYIDYALKNEVDRSQWVDFLSQSSWFENRKHYLSNSFYDVFSSYDKFFLGTYAFRQSYPETADFTATTDPWVLNGLYANRSVEPDPANGRFQFNYAWAEDFLSIQNSSN